MRVSQKIKEQKALDRYIDSKIEQLSKLKARATKITASVPQADRVSGGLRKSQDDLYAELIDAENELKQQIAEAEHKRREFHALIHSVDDECARDMLTMLYITKLNKQSIMDELCLYSDSQYYYLVRKANKALCEISE